MDTTSSLDLKEIQISPLSKDLVVRGFSCGEYSIDKWVLTKAVKHNDQYRTRVFCAHRNGSATVLGLYSLSLLIEQTDKLLADERRHYQNDKHFPAIYIQSLCVLQRYQNFGLGTILLMNALHRSHYIAQNVAVFGVSLRSLNDRTTNLYKKFGFGLRETCVHPIMVLPIWSLNELFDAK
jgi:ribosomal protein S18 acetylase RimI-like enzyme